MRFSLNIILVLLGVVLSTNGLKILGIFPYAGKSHFLNFQPITLKLAEMGHDVTVISHFPQKNPAPPRYRDISLAGASNMTMDAVNVADIYSLPQRLVQYLSIVNIVQIGAVTCNYLETEVLQTFIHSKNESFDVLLVEQFDTDCYLGFVHKFNVPWIGIASHIIMPFTNDRYGGVDNPSIVPNHFMDYSDRMGFLERVENSVMYLYTKAVHRYLGQLPAEKVVRKHFGEDVPPLDVLARSSSLLLTNTHYSLSLPRPLVPNMVEIGGIHIGKRGILPKVKK